MLVTRNMLIELLKAGCHISTINGEYSIEQYADSIINAATKKVPFYPWVNDDEYNKKYKDPDFELDIFSNADILKSEGG